MSCLLIQKYRHYLYSAETDNILNYLTLTIEDKEISDLYEL